MQTVNISAHISIELARKLEKVSSFEEKTKSFYIKKGLEKYLEEKLEDMEDYLDAKKAYGEFFASGEKGISLEEIKKKHNL